MDPAAFICLIQNLAPTTQQPQQTDRAESHDTRLRDWCHRDAIEQVASARVADQGRGRLSSD